MRENSRNQPNLRVVVMSDTHGKLPASLVERLDGADEIWHLGDVGPPDTLQPILARKIPLSVVRGNTDATFPWPTKLNLNRKGYRFALQHCPPAAAPDEADALLHGHLHYPVDETIGSCRVLSPGAVHGPRNQSAASFAWLEFPEAGRWTWKVETL